jgi:hypothetical protein
MSAIEIVKGEESFCDSGDFAMWICDKAESVGVDTEQLQDTYSSVIEGDFASAFASSSLIDVAILIATIAMIATFGLAAIKIAFAMLPRQIVLGVSGILSLIVIFAILGNR